jgi:hypothetical protein
MRLLRAIAVAGLLPATAVAQSTEFTYQGRLTDASAPADGSFDFELRLFDVPTGGTALATVERTGVPVVLGLFTVPVDFGDQWTGAARFLEIGVRPAGGGPYETLGARQPLTATPYASRSAGAKLADTATTALSADALGPACVLCVTDAHVLDLAGAKITGEVPVAAVPAGSAHYVQNGTAEQAASGFNVSGTGRVAGAFNAGTVTAATEYFVADDRVLAVPGSQNVFLGRFSGPANTSGFGNAFLGHFAGNVNTTGFNNTFVGTDTGRTNNGTGNTFVGRSSGFANVDGNQNAFLGLDAGRFNASGSANVMVGRAAGYSSTTGSNNTFVGWNSGLSNTVENGNTFLGAQANGAAGITNATAIGAGAVVNASNTMVLGTAAVAVRVPGTLAVVGTLEAAAFDADTFFAIDGATVLRTVGVDSLHVGPQAGPVSTGGQNAFVGASAGLDNSNGNRNTFVGASAGQQNTGGDDNVFVGVLAGTGNLTSSRNTFVGSSAGFANRASGGTFVGYHAGLANSLGERNTFVGYEAGAANTTGDDNSFLGRAAGTSSTTASFNTFVGYGAGYQNTTGNQNTFVGRFAGYGNETTSGNSYFGFQAGQGSSGHFNSFFGSNAGFANQGGFFNSFFGTQAGQDNTEGIGNAFFGYLAGRQNTTGDRNTFVGQESGSSNLTGNNNSALGWGAGVSSSALSFATAIGSGVTVGQSNTVQIGRPGDDVRVPDLIVAGLTTVSALGASGSVSLCRNASAQIATCSSSLRYKTDVTPLASGLEVVTRLRPIAFTWRDTGARDLGFAAEEVAAVAPLLATFDGAGEVEGVKYGQLTAVLVNAVREQQVQIARQQSLLDAQAAELQALRALVCRQSPDDGACR